MFQLNVVKRMSILVILPTIIVVFLVVFSVKQFHTIDSGVKRVYDDNIVPMLMLKTVSDSYQTITATINKVDKGLLLPDDAVIQIEKDSKSIRENWENFQTFVITEEENAFLKEVDALISSANASVKEIVGVLKSMNNVLSWDDFGETPMTQFNGDLYDIVDPITTKVDGLINIKTETAREERFDSAEILSKTQASFIIIASITVIALGLGGWLVVRSIVLPLSTLRNAIQLAEQDCDLNVKLDISSSDEIGNVAKAYQKMMQRFLNSLSDIQRAVTRLDENSATLADNTEESRALVRSQSEDTSSVATLTDQMTVAMERVSLDLESAATAAENAFNDCEKGKVILDQTMSTINVLSNKIQNVEVDMQRISADSHAINSILEAIRGIAEQTNLLALNAAIEAARAGDQGRGFAVVADEVRSLAQRTQDSTEEIRSMITRLQEGISEAVKNVSDGNVTMTSTLEEANSTKETLESIISSVKEINTMNQEVSRTSKDHMNTVNQVSQNTARIAQGCKKSDDAVATVDATSKELILLSNELKQVVSLFKIN